MPQNGWSLSSWRWHPALLPKPPPSADSVLRTVRLGPLCQMVHNGIEYGMMAALAEGFNLLEHADFASHLPPHAPGCGSGSLFLHAALGRHCRAVAARQRISSWLLDPLPCPCRTRRWSSFLRRSPTLVKARWTVQGGGFRCAVPGADGRPVRALQLARSGDDILANRLLSALRYQFLGGLHESCTCHIQGMDSGPL